MADVSVAMSGGEMTAYTCMRQPLAVCKQRSVGNRFDPLQDLGTGLARSLRAATIAHACSVTEVCNLQCCTRLTDITTCLDTDLVATTSSCGLAQPLSEHLQHLWCIMPATCLSQQHTIIVG
jgi:hypothetical protein